jgi:MoaA/NifB/PqqE/SkfB family radical SAM enzyme
MKNKDSFCVNPYLNFSIHPNGIIKPCCMSSKSYVSNNGSTTLDQDSILNFWQSQDRLKMIDDLNNGLKIPECLFCWDEEKSGKESKRIRDNLIFTDKKLSNDMLPIVADFSLGNLCNLKCRICSPTHSSLWAIEEANLKFQNTKEYFNDIKWKISKQSFSLENQKFWKDIYPLLDNIERLDFAGGEPFYIDNHWNIIKYCVDKKISKSQYLHYNTNGTIFPEKYIDLLLEFKTLDIQFSVDGIAEKFEYLRHPGKWKDLEYTIDKFVELKNYTDKDIRLSICFSLSAFNSYDLFEVYQYFNSKKLGIYINFVHDHRSVSVLPYKVRDGIIKHLESFNYNDSRWEIDKNICINFIKNQKYNKLNFEKFWNDIKKRDQYRKESFEKTFPEFFNLMKPYL